MVHPFSFVSEWHEVDDFGHIGPQPIALNLICVL